MAKAIKQPSGKYMCRVYDKNTKKQKCFTADTKKEAEKLAMMYKYTLDHKTDDLTFGEAYDMYIYSHKEWGAKTQQDRRTLRDTKYQELLDYPLDDLTNKVLQVWVDKTFKGLSGKTAANQFSPIRATLKRYRPNLAVNVELPKKVKPKLSLPSEADIINILNAVEDTDLCVPVYLAVFGAMRRGEIAALDMDHIDLAKRQIYIEYAIAVGPGHSWVTKTPKNGEPRKIKAPQILIDKIKEKGLPSLPHPDYITEHFEYMLKKNKLPHIRFHDLRHYCAARMLSSEPRIPISVVQKYGGWRDKKVLLEIYDYVIDEIDEASMDIWNTQSKQISSKLVVN